MRAAKSTIGWSMPGNALKVEGDFANCFVHINKDSEVEIRKGA